MKNESKDEILRFAKGETRICQLLILDRKPTNYFEVKDVTQIEDHLRKRRYPEEMDIPDSMFVNFAKCVYENEEVKKVGIGLRNKYGNLYNPFL